MTSPVSAISKSTWEGVRKSNQLPVNSKLNVSSSGVDRSVPRDRCDQVRSKIATPREHLVCQTVL